MNRIFKSWVIVLLIVFCLAGTGFSENNSATTHRAPDYKSASDWSIRCDSPDKPFDVFFVHPTTYGTTKMGMNASLDDPANRKETDETVLSQVSVFKERCNIYAPRYRQMSIAVLSMTDEEAKPYFDIALQDVTDAFKQYMQKYNNGRPFFLASHSQGSDMLHSFLQEHRELLNDDQLVAAYLIGWTFTDADLQAFNLPLAVTPTQLGGLITWNTVGEGGNSPTLRQGANCVNPLTWTDSNDEAPASLDICAVIPLNSGSVTTIPHFTAAAINAEGGLQVPTPAILDQLNMSMGKEVYHRYDYAFFYSNLVQNVGQRCDAWNTQQTIKEEMKTMKAPDYSDDTCWVTKPETLDKPVDVFYIYPTIYVGTNTPNMDINDPALRSNAEGLLTAQAGVYSPHANLFAPFYRQQSAALQSMEAGNGGADAYQDPVFLVGAGDVEQAFEYYLENLNPDRPFIIASHSQGTMNGINLMRKYFDDPALQERLVAAYLLGYSVTDKDLEKYPWMKLAQGETDTGVIITFNTEGENAGPSPVLLPGASVINPLNWKTDSTPATRDANLGAKFYIDQTGELIEEIPNFAGAYIDTEKGVLIATDVQPTHSDKINLDNMGRWPKGVFHRYDYAFWYNNLLDNVQKRIDAYLNQ